MSESIRIKSGRNYIGFRYERVEKRIRENSKLNYISEIYEFMLEDELVVELIKKHYEDGRKGYDINAVNTNIGMMNRRSFRIEITEVAFERIYDEIEGKIGITRDYRVNDQPYERHEGELKL